VLLVCYSVRSLPQCHHGCFFICYVIEADMLLEGSYKQDMEKIFDVFKVLRRRLMKKFDMKVSEVFFLCRLITSM
jgi:hypothetical protein